MQLAINLIEGPYREVTVSTRPSMSAMMRRSMPYTCRRGDQSPKSGSHAYRAAVLRGKRDVATTVAPLRRSFRQIW